MDVYVYTQSCDTSIARVAFLLLISIRESLSLVPRPLPHVTTPVGSIPTYALMVLLLPYTRRSYIPSTHLNRVDE